MFEIGVVICIIISYVALRYTNRNKSEQEALPPPTESGPPAHPYQKQIDKHSSAMIKEIELSLSKGYCNAEIMGWKDSYQLPLKQEVMRVVKEHFKHYEDKMELHFSESSYCLRARIILK